MELQKKFKNKLGLLLEILAVPKTIPLKKGKTVFQAPVWSMLGSMDHVFTTCTNATALLAKLEPTTEPRRFNLKQPSNPRKVAFLHRCSRRS